LHPSNGRGAKEADYCLPFKRASSSASQHGRSTFSSGKSAFCGLGPPADIAVDLPVHCSSTRYPKSRPRQIESRRGDFALRRCPGMGGFDLGRDPLTIMGIIGHQLTDASGAPPEPETSTRSICNRYATNGCRMYWTRLTPGATSRCQHRRMVLGISDGGQGKCLNIRRMNTLAFCT
jgi:hypothetical protein